MDTIYAPSSAIGGAIAVIRISGPNANRITEVLERDIKVRPGYLVHSKLMDGETVADDCMAVYFKAPHSYTGEDMVEINCHGGPMTVKTILTLLRELNFRPAEPGEFTKRAFENGKMDLSQAEAVMDVVTAGAERSLRAAVRQLEGGVKQSVTAVESLLLDALSGIDAAIDYPDETELETLIELPKQLAAAESELDRLIQNGKRGRVLRDGVRVVILGKPNVGKSSLLNCLLNEERAIVTDVPGTTRDVLDERSEIDGVPIRFVDTAGIREARDEAEQIGVGRAKREAENADLVLLLLDGSKAMDGEDQKLLAETADQNRVILINKCDLAQYMSPPTGALKISAKLNLGIDSLKQAILAQTAPGAAEETLITNERHIRALDEALMALRQIKDNHVELDCASTDIRDALKALGAVTGSDVDEEVIDRIFSRFCVGK